MLQLYLKEVYTFINSLGFLANANVTFYSTDSSLLPSDPTDYHPDKRMFCKKINSNTSLHLNCTKSDSLTLSDLNNSDEPFKVYKCHTGLVEFAFRITLANTLIGYAIIGPFRDPKTEKEDIERIHLLSSQLKEPYENLLHDFLSIEKITEQKIFALKNLSWAIFDYMGLKNYIAIKENIFTLQIEPYIQQHLDENLNVEFLCKKFHLSQKMLYRIFHNSTQQTPKQYILNAKIKRSIHLLNTTDLSIPEIAEKIGFSDFTYFSKTFKTVTGQSPTSYRKKK